MVVPAMTETSSRGHRTPREPPVAVKADVDPADEDTPEPVHDEEVD
jgi:hypothetical protein